MSQPSALELSLRLVHNRRWGRSYRHGRHTMFTPIAANNRNEASSSGSDDDSTIIYIEHFREQPQLSRNP